jgi:hypothetical protein
MERAGSRPESSETVRRTGLKRARKIQSELHGDMQSQAEMSWPPGSRSGVTKLVYKSGYLLETPSIPHYSSWASDRAFTIVTT